MGSGKYEPGMLVRHPDKAEWGLGRVLEVHGNKLKVHFKDDDQDVRTLSVEKISLAIVLDQSDLALDNLPPFLGDRFDVKAKKVTFDDGVEKFLHEFPRGFADPAYLGTGKLGKGAGERGYKQAAHESYTSALGGGQGEKLLSQGQIDDLSQRACSVVSHQLNLLSKFELMAFKDALAASQLAASRFFGAVFECVASEGPNEEDFRELAEAVAQLPAKPDKARVATWPVLTILPFLARPDAFMFLKPDPTRECAHRLRFDLQYDPVPRWITYRKLMAMSQDLLERLRRWGARDYIDVQSFMWVIAKY